MKTHLLIIDPQMDFAWPGLGHFVDINGSAWRTLEPMFRHAFGDALEDIKNPGRLCVPGAWDAMQNLSRMITRNLKKIDDITVTLDSHQIVDQSHSAWWVGQDGRSVPPFTSLVAEDFPKVRGSTVNPATGETIDLGYFMTRMPSFLNRGGATGKGSFGYLSELKANGRYPHTIWPVHCEIGSIGTSIVPHVMSALRAWQDTFALVNFATKGSNPETEHYGALRAEVIHQGDPTTGVNTDMVANLMDSDIILVAGIAENFCLANTVIDIAEAFNDPALVRKIVLLTDATAPVPGFDFLTKDFYDKMLPMGMRRSTCGAFFA